MTLADARSWAATALQWLVDDGLVFSVEVDAKARDQDVLALTVAITRQPGTTPTRFDFIWKDI